MSNIENKVVDEAAAKAGARTDEVIAEAEAKAAGHAASTASDFETGATHGGGTARAADTTVHGGGHAGPPPAAEPHPAAHSEPPPAAKPHPQERPVAAKPQEKPQAAKAAERDRLNDDGHAITAHEPANAENGLNRYRHDNHPIARHSYNRLGGKSPPAGLTKEGETVWREEQLAREFEQDVSDKRFLGDTPLKRNKRLKIDKKVSPPLKRGLDRLHEQRVDQVKAKYKADIERAEDAAVVAERERLGREPSTAEIEAVKEKAGHTKDGKGPKDLRDKEIKVLEAKHKKMLALAEPGTVKDGIHYDPAEKKKGGFPVVKTVIAVGALGALGVWGKHLYDKAKSRKSSDTPDAGTGDDSTQSGAPASTAPAITVPGPQPLSALGLAVQSQFVDQPYINFTDANKARLAFDKDGPFLNYDVNGANDAQHSGTVRLQPGQKVTLANGDTLTADSAGIVTVTHGNATAKIGYDADKRAIVDSSAVPKGGPAPQSAAPAAAAPDAAADGTPKPDAAAAPAPAAAGDDVFANMDLSRPPRQQLGAATAAGVPAPQEKRVAPPAAVTPPPPAKRASQVQINWN